MTANQLIDFLQALENRLGSSAVRAFFRDQPPRVQNEYSLLRGDVSFLLGELTVNRLNQVSQQLNAHSAVIAARTADLKKELDDLASARKILTRLDKTISIVSRVAMYLL